MNTSASTVFFEHPMSTTDTFVNPLQFSESEEEEDTSKDETSDEVGEGERAEGQRKPPTKPTKPRAPPKGGRERAPKGARGEEEEGRTILFTLGEKAAAATDTVHTGVAVGGEGARVTALAEYVRRYGSDRQLRSHRTGSPRSSARAFDACRT